MTEFADSSAARCGSLLERIADRYKPARTFAITSTDRKKLEAAGVKWPDTPAPVAPVAPKPIILPPPKPAFPVQSPNMPAAIKECLDLGAGLPRGGFKEIAFRHGLREQTLRNAVTRAKARLKKSSAEGKARYVVGAKHIAGKQEVAK